MARARAMTRRMELLPPGLREALKQRLAELAGGALLFAALILTLALVTYDRADPSFNTVTRAAPHNLLGLPGAYAADALLQGFGMGAVVIVLALASWGFRIATRRGLPWWLLNLVALPFAVLASSVALAVLPVPIKWPPQVGLGGAVGDIFAGAEIVPLLQAHGIPYATLAPGPIGLALLLVVLPLTLGLSWRDWRGIGRGAATPAQGLARDLGQVSRALKPAAPVASPMLVVPEKREPLLNRLVSKTKIETKTKIDAPVEPIIMPTSAPKVERRAERPKTGKRREEEAQPALALEGDSADYLRPPLALLGLPKEPRTEAVNEEALEQNARLLKSVLEEFGVVGEIVKVRPGPVVTLYELEPAPGTKSSRVIGLADDIARSMSALAARIAVIPGRNAIGIELPNAKRETVLLRELLETADYENNPSKLGLALGKDIGGQPVIADLARMPHLLVAGTTGSGKSVAINTMILSLLYRLTPDECRLIMIDPKMLELSVYDGIPHLLTPVVTDPPKAVLALKWTVREMEERYRKMSELGVRNIASYNQRVVELQAKSDKMSRTVQTGFDPSSGQPIFEERPFEMETLPYIVVVVDELADLMLVAGKDIEALIQRLAQMARAAGIHLIMATQRPSVDVITGTIKANFPTRISFQVTSKIDSRTILGEQGAEQLLGQGDMLFMPGAGRITRVHGPFVSDEEVEKVVAHLKQQGTPTFIEGVTAEPTDLGRGAANLLGDGEAGGEDDLYRRAVELIRRERKASTSFVQRHLQIGYNRAARIIERMEAEGVVGCANHVGKREVLAPELAE